MAITRLLQVVFVIDVTFATRAHYNNICKEYLQPIIVALKSSCATASPPFVTEYAVVMFGDLAPYADFVVRSSKFTRDAGMVLGWIKKVVFRGAGCSTRSHVAAGLCAALQLGRMHDADQRCIVLITSNLPRTLSCGMCDAGGDALMHAGVAASRRVCLSVIASSHTTELEQLFTTADPNRLGSLEGLRFILSPNATQLNPAKAVLPSHFVALRGLQIPIAAAAQRHAGSDATPPTSQFHPLLQQQQQQLHAQQQPQPAALQLAVVYTGLLRTIDSMGIPPFAIRAMLARPDHAALAAEIFANAPPQLQIVNLLPRHNRDGLTRLVAASLPLVIEPATAEAQVHYNSVRQLFASTGQSGMLMALNRRKPVLHLNDNRLLLFMVPIGGVTQPNATN